MNLEKVLVAWLEGRGRRLRAGNAPITRYLSVQLHCGPNRLDDLTTLLRNPPESLYVEQTDTGKIILVGLAAWQDCEEILTDDVPEDQDSAWRLIADLYSKIGTLTLAAQGVETALQMASEAEGHLKLAEQELEGYRGHRCALPVSREDNGETTELQLLEQECARLRSAVNSRQEALNAKSDELERSEQRRRAAERETKKLKRWFDENREILEIVTPLVNTHLSRRGSSVQLAILSN